VSNFSDRELELLAGARRALGPSEHDAARVLHKAKLAIESGAVPAAQSAVVATKSAGAAIAKKALAWLAIAGSAAWLGYGAGFQLGQHRARDARAGTPAERAPQVRAVVAPPVEAREQPSGPSLEPPRTDPIISRTPEAPRRKPKAPAAPLLAPEADEAPVLAAPPPAPNASLDAEIKALRYVERALRNREPHNALARLTQLDGEVPQGQMMEERAAARAMARCEERAQNGTPDQAEVMKRVLEFSQLYPASVYFARVRQTCLATSERDAATD